MRSEPTPAGSVALIDGYNVIMQHPQWKALELIDARRRLVRAVANVRWPTPVRQVEVIFDGSQADQGVGAAGVRMWFAVDADAEIQQRIRRESRGVIVVSDDREIAGTAKSHGVPCHGVRWLLGRMGTEAGGAPAPPSALSETDRRRISEELARRWRLSPPKGREGR